MFNVKKVGTFPKNGFAIDSGYGGSGYGIGGAIQQFQDGHWRLIVCASRTLTPGEKNYPIIELELLGVVWTISKFRNYLHGREFTLLTDHHSLCWLETIKNPKPRVARWRYILSEFEFKIVYRKGKENCLGDHLSRYPLPRNPASEPDDFPIFFISSETIKQHQQQDPWIQEHKTDPRYSIASETGLHVIERRSEKGPTYKVIVPATLKRKIMTLFHDDLDHGGHFGVYRTTEEIKKRFYWKRMTRDIKDYIRTCETCQFRNKRQQVKIGSLQTIRVDRPFEVWAIDAIGPLPTTKRKNKIILTMVDHFTKQGEAEALPDQTGERVVKFLDRVSYALASHLDLSMIVDQTS